MKSFMLFILVILSFTAFAQSPVGTWKTVDEESGEVRSHVEIYEQGGLLFGKITQLLDKDPNALCNLCSGKKKNQPVVGLVIIEKMKSNQNAWENGKILDPETGKEYNCELWMEDGNLKVKGKHWTGFSRTQTWYRL
ncbi:MAG: DUF2147 domain-containing protein [Bacteroidota bacterium]